MNVLARRIKESPLYQGANEEIAYELTTTPWGSDPSAVAVYLEDSDGTDVSDDHLTGDASAAGDVITTPVVHSLVSGSAYRLLVRFTVGGSVEEAFAELYGQA